MPTKKKPKRKPTAKTAKKTKKGAKTKKTAKRVVLSGGGPKPKKKKAVKNKKKKPTKGTCMILMPFKEPFDIYYEAIIKPAVIVANLEPLRGDSLFRAGPIMADVWQMIQDSEVLVAELTGKNANVFYELGLGHAIGKPIVLVAETMDDVPFDLRALRVILYDKNNPAWGNKLKNELVRALTETLLDPIESVPSMFRKKVKSQAPAESELSSRMSELERYVFSLKDKFTESEIQGRELKTDILTSLLRANSKADINRIIQYAISSGFTLKELEFYVKRYFPQKSAKNLVRDAIENRK
ncbi:MAG: hypothetical protein V3W18_14045 [candidate division Zixibacteria bacterium]